jgi:hypothetical protein
MKLRLLIQDTTVYEGDPIPIPRVGEAVRHEGDAVPVESVTWDFQSADLVVVAVVLGARPYTY